MKHTQTSVSIFALVLALALAFLSSCSSGGGGAPSNLSGGPMGGPSVAERKAQIASEPTGNFYYGRRYFVDKTRFWGYLRKPRQSAKKGRLVVMNESRKTQPDRLPEDGPSGRRYGFDQNYQYKIFGRFTGDKIYDPNSNQILDEFLLTDYQVVNKEPGWLFSPNDRYDPKRITLSPRY